MLIEYKGKRPTIGNNVFIAPNAVILGDVHIGDNVSIWYNTVIRADVDTIRIGNNSNIQDNSTIHVDPGKPCTIGEYVTLGHNVVVHGSTIEDYCLIGINSTVLNGTHIKRGSIIASNAMVRENQEIGPYHLVAGVPAVLKKEMDEETAIAMVRKPAESYLQKTVDYQNPDLVRMIEA